MWRQMFRAGMGIAILGIALSACSNTPHVLTSSADSESATAHHGCAGCKAGYVRVVQMANGHRIFAMSKRSQFAFRELVGIGKGPGITVAQGAWWTSGGLLRITAARGQLGAGWEELGAHVKAPHAVPPPAGTLVAAGWYNAILVCRTARCDNVAVAVNGKPVEPYAPPQR